MDRTESTPRLLLVEDDFRLANSTREYLESHNFEVLVEHRGDTAINRIHQDAPELVILDLMLPGLDGLEVCRQVRPDFCAPILMLTARDDTMEQVVGLEVGADDYVFKPVVPRVLLARIRALLRHNQRISDDAKVAEQPTVTLGSLYINYNHRIITWADTSVGCTEVEFELLWLLASHAGQILSRDFLYNKLKGHDHDGIDRLIDIRISRLRKKFEDNLASPTRIKTVRGRGYVLVPSAWG